MYENKQAGVQKASHERMLNDRGRKVIKEKMGQNNFNSYDHFKGMHANDASNFDQDWSRMANEMGFRPMGGNALEYGGNDPFADNRGGNQNYRNRIDMK